MKQSQDLQSAAARPGVSQSVYELFEQQVALAPDAIAIFHNGQHLSYRELNALANQMAQYLRKAGVRPEVAVGVCLERSAEMVLVLLAILKAGGVYLPLDPQYPKERLQFMLSDSGARFLLSERSLQATLPENKAVTLWLDEVLEQTEKESRENPAPLAESSNLAYIIYTSGSTGIPKAVMVQHGGVCNLIAAQKEAFVVEPQDRVLQFASLSFDASVSEIFVTLGAGAVLCLASRECLMPGPDLTRTLDEGEIDLVTLPPTIVLTLRPERVKVRTLVVAGEDCPEAVAAAWSSGRTFINAYGPTEYTVCASIGTAKDQHRKPSIGRPIANTQIYILNDAMQPVAEECAGEIYVGGDGLARGYLNRAAGTAETFIPDGLSGSPGRRLYRTGDLGRWDQDGELEFIGRRDRQVKLRGFRIETGEIEAALQSYPGVDKAVVVVMGEGSERRLIAYLVSRDKEITSANHLRRQLKARLPEYMIPSEFVQMESLPFTANGKVDISALSVPAMSVGGTISSSEAPGNGLHSLLIRLWKEVLGLEDIDLDRNFFDIGDSIHAAKFLNKLQDALGEVVYIVALFDAPTIASLSNYLAEHYPEAVGRICGAEVPAAKPNDPLDELMVADLRQKIVAGRLSTSPLVPLARKNPRAVFVLSPPRSGSTLLRVMLAGHPQLFAPPELQLLPFSTLAERKRTFSGRYAFWLEGAIRSVMEAQSCSGDQAARLMERFEHDELSVQEFYRVLQSWIGSRMLVDKTPAYALDADALARAELYFDEPLYIHLLRHPAAMIQSFRDAKLDQIFRYDHSFSTGQLAELIWIVSQQNIMAFLESLPQERHIQVKFEDVLHAPHETMRSLCGFLGIEFDPEMIEPHANQEHKMTDGIHGLSRMIGDIKFHEHRRIDPQVATRWQTLEMQPLSEMTLQLASTLGYGSAVEPRLTAIPALPRRSTAAAKR